MKTELDKLNYLNNYLNTNYESYDEVGWGYISQYKILSEDFIREMKDYINWSLISEYQKLSESFIREFQDKVDWKRISRHQKLSESFIREMKDYINRSLISKYQDVSEEFIDEFCKAFKDKLNYFNNYFNENYKSLDKLNWGYISEQQTLSEDFIREFQDYVCWYYISRYQTLSEDFIREFKDNVVWDWISQYQTLSESFIIEFRNYLNWEYINKFQKLSPNFFIELEKNCKDFRYTWIPSWKELTTEQKKKEITNSGLYDCQDNHFIAYKAVRKDRSSWYSPKKYTYLEGKTYTSDADYSNEENSYGLSIWTEQGAKEFGDEYLSKNYLVLKVEVCYEDVARLVHESNKIRCTKFKVIT